MLVVDRTVITQLQADQTGIDFMELSANLIRAHHLRYSSTPSILDSDTTSKGLSPISLGYSPPSYEDIFGDKNNDLPPSYSELSLLFRQRHLEFSEMQTFNLGSMNERNEDLVRETVLDINEIGNEEQMCNSVQEVNVRRKEGDNGEEIAISVPSHIQDINLPSHTNSAGVEDEDSYPNCKYCIMSLENDHKAKIKCYCYEDSADASNECVLRSRTYDSSACSSARLEVENNSSECSVYNVEPITADYKTISETDVIKNGSNLSKFKEYDKKCTLNNKQSDEDKCQQSCEDIRESSL